MVSQTNEQALEATIEKQLTGTCLEELKGAKEPNVDGHSDYYQLGLARDFNAQYAIDNHFFWSFLHNTQANELDKLQKNHPYDWQRKVLDRFDKLIKKYGIIHLLKKGLAIDDIHLTLMYPAPLASSGEQVKHNFAQNIFSCTRQVRYSQLNPLQEIDMVLFINGIAIITLELKNPWTGQTAQYHGQKQYREDRDINQPLLTFARCLVHMTVDTDEVYMTTKLAGKDTVFLPFNKGNNEGKGNPVNPSGHKTAYLWESIFKKASIANIIQHFVRLDGSSKDLLTKRTLFFPRYHQLDVVRKLIEDVASRGTGHTYLIQHSAGSGKSNSITWAAYQLIEVCPHNNSVTGAKGIDLPLFDSVIVVTDRRLLDKQLRDNISGFSEVKNIIAHAQKSSDLKAALENGKKIIITTIQKFQVIVDSINDLSDKRFAVIIDEAHSSQSGSAHDNMNKTMGKTANVDTNENEDIQDVIIKTMQARKLRGNASYFAFTATPKNITLEKFGDQQADGTFKPFHLYSMKQAIEEGFILDVLTNYTTYKSYYEIEKSISDNPLFDTQKAQKKLRAFVERSKQTIAVKAEIMLDHFLNQVVNSKKLKGKAKGMVVTQNIESAIHYYFALNEQLKQLNYPFKILIAFSGDKEIDGIEYSETSINGFSDNDTSEKFDSDEYRLLVVANKYLTGFDQPKLCTMYVDKKLQHVLAVQALSRLNRAAPKWGKKTEDLFVLDFFNSIEDIKQAFDPFYTATSLSHATDINVLHELKDMLDEPGIYEWHEVETFNQLYFKGSAAELLSPIIDLAADRFNVQLELDNDDKVDFKIKAKQFVKIYSQMAAIIPFEMPIWEKLFWFLKFLIPKLKVKDPDMDKLDELLESVDLNSYGLQRVKLNHKIQLDTEDAELDPQNANPRGAHTGESEESTLDDIVNMFNERWFQGWSITPEDQRVKFISIVQDVTAHKDFDMKYKNNHDPYNRELAFERIMREIMLENRQKDMQLYQLYAHDPAFRSAFLESIKRQVGLLSK